MACRILKSRKVVFKSQVRAASLVLENGRIAAIGRYSDEYDGDVIDYGSKAILPGLVDTHVHFNEPGRTEWEGWRSGTTAAIAGGVTTIVEMPLNSIPSTVDSASLKLKIDSTKEQLFCDVGLWGGAVPGNLDKFEELLEGGVLGFKAFMSDPGTAEFRHLDEEGLRQAMLKIASLNSILLLHAEWPAALKEPNPELNPQSYASWLSTRPVEAERQAIELVIRLAQETGCRCHVVHVASPEVLDLFQQSKVSCETCAHYLSFAAEGIADKATNFKCAPPIRESYHREGLWRALLEQKIAMITSDHSPCTPDLKNQNFLESWGGIAGVQMLLSAVWTGAYARGFSLIDLCRWLSLEPAKLAGLASERGSIEIGKLAHLVVFDPEALQTIEKLYHRHQGSPYEGRTWKGVVEATYLYGQQVFDGVTIDPKARGQLILGKQQQANH